MNNFLRRTAAGKNDPLLYLVGAFLVFAGYFLGQIPLIIAQSIAIRNNPEIDTAVLKEFEETMNFGLFDMHTNTGFMLMICIFIVAMIALFGVLMIHRKSIHDISTGRRTLDFQRILWAFGVWMVLGVVFEGVNYLIQPEIYEFRFKAGSFLVLLLICTFLLPIQTSLEEFFFRGYLFQGIYSLTGRAWVPLVLTTLMFASVHLANPEVDKYGLLPMSIYYILAGLFLAIITLWDDGLELALGVHFATNFFGASFLSYEGSVLQTDTLFKTSEINVWAMTAVFILSAVIFTYLAKRKYGFELSVKEWFDFNPIPTSLNNTKK